jgi:hypothetical protein
MAAMSNFLENELIDQIFRGRAYTFPSALYVALFTATPSDTGGGTEVSGGSYARVNLAPSNSNWAGTGGEVTATDSAGTTGTTTNKGAITFPAPTANWGVITSFGIFDASTAGNLLFYGALTTSKTVNNGDAAPSFAIDALSIQLDN